MSNSIKVSVITACFNSAAFLEEAILSVLSQTHSNLELILIDDGSTDDTLEIARRYRAKDNRIVLIPLSENSGPASARNAGIETRDFVVSDTSAATRWSDPSPLGTPTSAMMQLEAEGPQGALA